MRLSPTTPNGLRIFAIEPVWAIWTSSAMPTPSSREPFQRHRTAFGVALATPEGTAAPIARPTRGASRSVTLLHRCRDCVAVAGQRGDVVDARDRDALHYHGDHDLAAALRVGVADEGPGAGMSLREF